MICSYIRQTSQYSSFEYLDSPAQFDVIPEGLSCYKNIVYLTNANEQEKNMHVYSVGYEVADPTKALLNRIFPSYMILHYIVGGEGSFNGRPIRRGDCAIAFRNRSHSLCTDPEHPLRFYWVMFKHPETFSPAVFGLDPERPIFAYHFEKQMKRILEEMLHFHSNIQDPHWFYLGKFYELMSYHCQPSPQAQQPSRHHAYNNYVALAKRIWEQTSYGLSVEDVAHSLGFSRKHFSLIFSSQTGIMPQQYILQHKIRLAKLRMEAGESSLKNLAFQLGYSDYPSFSRAFKHQTGISPHEFLQQVKKSNAELPDKIDPPGRGRGTGN